MSSGGLDMHHHLHSWPREASLSPRNTGAVPADRHCSHIRQGSLCFAEVRMAGGGKSRSSSLAFCPAGWTPPTSVTEPFHFRVGRGSPCTMARGTRVGAWLARTPLPGTAPFLRVKRVLTSVGLRRVSWVLGRDRPSRGAGDTEPPHVRACPGPTEMACSAPLSSRTVPCDGRKCPFRPYRPSQRLSACSLCPRPA